jgi:hypothetical protein
MDGSQRHVQTRIRGHNGTRASASHSEKRVAYEWDGCRWVCRNFERLVQTAGYDLDDPQTLDYFTDGMCHNLFKECY